MKAMDREIKIKEVWILVGVGRKEDNGVEDGRDLFPHREKVEIRSTTELEFLKAKQHRIDRPRFYRGVPGDLLELKESDSFTVGTG